jgi:hypothetical protein
MMMMMMMMMNVIMNVDGHYIELGADACMQALPLQGTQI